MPKFEKSSLKELRAYLYDSAVHDATIEKIDCNYGADCMEISLWNPFFKRRIDLTFRNIELVFARKGKEFGSRDTVISLTAEEDTSYLQTYLSTCSEYPEGALYLLFQMLSGDELHIVAKEVTMIKE